MIFIETPAFDKRRQELLTDEEYQAFQNELVADPSLGEVIKDTGGLRKVRVGMKGKGKRGGGRAIYFHFVSESQIALMFIYPKNEAEDLTATERKALKKYIENWRQ